MAGNVSQIELDIGSGGGDGSDDEPGGALPVPPNTSTLRKLLAKKYPKLADFVLEENGAVTLALNEEYVLPGQVLPLKDGDTVALIPPISGG